MPNKMTRFTQRARRVLSHAQESAEKLHHPAIDSDHMLIGMMREQSGLAARVLSELNLPISQLGDVEKLCEENHKDDVRDEDTLDLSDETKRILEMAVDEATRMGHHYLGTEHLLLGICRMESSHALTILDNFQITRETIRNSVREMMQSAPPPEADSEQISVNREIHVENQTRFVMLRSLLQSNLLNWMGRSSSPERREQARVYIRTMFDHMTQTPGFENYPEADRMQLFNELMAAFTEVPTESTFTLRVEPRTEGTSPLEVTLTASDLSDAINKMMLRDTSEDKDTIFLMDTPHLRIEIKRNPPEDDSEGDDS